MAKLLRGPEDDMGLPQQPMGKIFHDKMKKRPCDRTIMIDETTNEEIKYGQLLKIVYKTANALTKLGVKKGDVVTIVAENNWKYMATIIACFLMGVTVNLLNHDYTTDELTHFLKISQPVLIFCNSKSRETILKLKNKSFFVAKNIIIYNTPTSDETKNFDELLETVTDEPFEPVDLDPKDSPALILTSSGTTGFPKCVVLTHANFRITMLYSNDSDGLDVTEKEATIAYLPYFHVFGCSINLACILYGTKCIILNKFKPDNFLKVIQDHKVTKIFTVPPIIQFFAKSPMIDEYDLSSLTDIVCGGSSVTEELLEMVEKRLKIKAVRQVYGLTELSGAATMLPKSIAKRGTVGIVTRTNTVKVCDPETGKMLPSNQSGEIRVSGPAVMKGYLGNDKETQEAFDEEGFLKTGDLGYYDKNDLFYIVDRLKEMIKYKGFQVSPAELENLLVQHPAVKDAGVVGIPDERAGELPLALIVKMPDSNVTEEELTRYVEEHVSIQKRLYGGVKFVEEIPKSASGKILRKKLNEMV